MTATKTYPKNTSTNQVEIKTAFPHKKIAKSEQQFRQIADLLPSKISNADAAGNVTYFNKHWLDYTGMDFEELRLFGYHKIIHPDDLVEFQSRFLQASQTGNVLEMEMRFLDKHGNYKWHLNLASPVKDKNKIIIMWVGNTTEIHDQITQKTVLEKAILERTNEIEQANKELVFQNKEKEKRASELFTANKELIFQNKEKEKRANELLIANKELAYQSNEKEKRADELLIANKELAYQSAEKEKRADELLIANKELIYQSDEKQKRADELLIANIELAFQSDEKEKRADELLIANKELAFQGAEKEKRAVELILANKELESFTYISSHDLQEPLRKIQTFAGRILEKEYATLSVNGKDYFQRIQNSAKRMQALIEDLLTYSHTNITERKFEKTSLNKVVEDVKNELSEMILQKNAVIKVGKLCELTINPSQFRQVINNLITNAIKFAKPHIAPHITIKSSIDLGSQFQKLNSNLALGNFSANQTYCHIVFTDNGIGFEPEYRDKIFELFQRLHGKEDYAGTGIGLAIVKKIIDNHNGIITASGKLSKGAKFDIYIPVG